MPKNVEIKARVADLDAVEMRVRPLATSGPFEIAQDDTFFPCAQGRLKLRELAPDRGELICYARPDTAGPKVSDYKLVPTSTPGLLREALAAALGVLGRVVKVRRLYLVGRTRVHLDRVAGLGEFLELEVVLAESEDAAVGEAEARHLLTAFGVAPEDLVVGAYLDLLRFTPTRSS
ncbi:MAG: class IV adenylate cyclase [Thermoanaerobaculia bacterium]|nr:class IV adenylate cyclase [Thermoanaerobaculia bacterium]